MLENHLFNLTPLLECVDMDIALALLKKSDISLIDAVRLVLELLEATQGRSDLPYLRRIIMAGHAQVSKEDASISFAKAVELTLMVKQDRTQRTLQDIRQTSNALMRDFPKLERRPICSLSTQECERMLQTSFGHSPSRFIKARANLSGVFTVAYRRGYCQENPVTRISCPNIIEKEKRPLSLPHIQQLINTARHPLHHECLPALGLMLYAGVRPDEVSRLSWDDIDWEEQILYMSPRHTKTGGGRHIPLVPPLMKMLEMRKKSSTNGNICPASWKKRWQFLRQAAGFDTWVPDVLRHTYASYHAKKFRNLPDLQMAMGHRDCQLLLTRYINLRGLTRRDAKEFWKGSMLYG